MNKIPYRHHPIVIGSAMVSTFIVLSLFLTSLIPPAWAAIPIQITDRITIDLGELPPWITAIVAAAGLWKAWRSEKASLANAVKIGKVQDDVKLIERNTNSLTTQLKEAAHRDGTREGIETGKQIGVDAAVQLAEGQRQGVESERASVAAANTVPPAAEPHAAAGGKKPLPVADDRTAGAAERSASALERTAAATEEKK